jgi:hypothetical protein
MTLAEARRLVIELDAEVKRAWAPDAWAMFVCTAGGHLQWSLNRPKHWPLATFDIRADAPDWPARFQRGAQDMRDAVAALDLARALPPLPGGRVRPGDPISEPEAAP